MILRAEQLAGQLQKNLMPVYLLSGDEPLLVQEAVDQVRVAARAHGYHEREIYQTETHFNWETLSHNLQSVSLFSEKRLIELHLTQNTIGQAGSKFIQHYTKHLLTDNLLLIVCPKLDKKLLQSAWIKALNQAGIVIQIWPINAAQLPQWLKQRLQTHSLTATPEALAIFAAYTEGNLLAAHQEILKMQLLFSGKPKMLDVTDIQQIISQHNRYEIFQLTEATLMRDKSRIHKIMMVLQAQGTEPILILWAITRELRFLIALAHGEQPAGLWPQRLQLLNECLQHHTRTQLYTYLQQAFDIDTIIKGANRSNVWEALLLLCFALT